MPARQRREAMLDDAAEHFARFGFESTTRDLARALGVTQALIYRHFESKDDLIERTLERMFSADSGTDPWIDQDGDLATELLRFYLGFVDRSSELRMRLFIRAGLDGRSWPTRRGNRLTTGLFLPVIAALRAAADLPSLHQRAAMRGERELVMTLHASMVFLGIRRHVYGMKMPDRLDDVVALYVTNFLTGAPATLQALHDSGPDSLTVALAAGPM